MKTLAAIALTIMLGSALPGCSRSSDAPPGQSADRVAADALESGKRNERLLAAAEPYEALTESAFIKSPEELERMRKSARDEAARIVDILAPADADRLDALDEEIARAVTSGARPDIALGAVESYKVLVSAQGKTAVVPREVSLLDYAGFRYDALAKATPSRWSEMGDTAAYADEVWAKVASSVSDAALAARFDAALAAMREAVDRQDVDAAQSSVQSELALVDELEVDFSRSE
jgi:hypothetical protein